MPLAWEHNPKPTPPLDKAGRYQLLYRYAYYARRYSGARRKVGGAPMPADDASHDMTDPTDLNDLGRFSDPSLLILASLAGGPKHGYAMMEDIEQMSGTRLGP